MPVFCFNRIGSSGEDSKYMKGLGKRIWRLQIANIHETMAEDAMSKAVDEMAEIDHYSGSYLVVNFRRVFTVFAVTVLAITAFILGVITS